MRFFFIAILGALFASPALGDSMRVGGETSQPVGHYWFCMAHKAECRFRPLDQRILKLTPKIGDTIMRINKEVNRSIHPMNDADIYGEDEVWAYPALGVGDCEDYVLEKRKRLNEAGVSLSNLLITVVRQANGIGHAVLTVRTNHGDLILDNLRPEILSWRKTGYKYLKRQASYYTGRWVTLHFPENDLLLTAEVR